MPKSKELQFNIAGRNSTTVTDLLYFNSQLTKLSNTLPHSNCEISVTDKNVIIGIVSSTNYTFDIPKEEREQLIGNDTELTTKDDYYKVVVFTLDDEQELQVIGKCTFDSILGFDSYINNVYIDVNFRRQGIAATMLRYCLKQIKNRGFDGVQLDSLVEAVKLYEYLDFKYIKINQSDINDELFKYIKPMRRTISPNEDFRGIVKCPIDIFKEKEY